MIQLKRENGEFIERISFNEKTLAEIIRAGLKPSQTIFFTSPEFKQQVGFIVYQKGEEIARHIHRPLERHLVGTSEVLIIRRGRCEVDIYNNSRELVVTMELQEGDILIIVSGGHSFRMIEDTVILEIKQGPYIGLQEKERF